MGMSEHKHDLGLTIYNTVQCMDVECELELEYEQWIKLVADGLQLTAATAHAEQWKTLWRRYIAAADAGIIQSSSKDGTWNIEQEARAALAAHDALQDGE
jgi:hypothetical protein